MCSFNKDTEQALTLAHIYHTLHTLFKPIKKISVVSKLSIVLGTDLVKAVRFGDSLRAFSLSLRVESRAGFLKQQQSITASSDVSDLVPSAFCCVLM